MSRRFPLLSKRPKILRPLLSPPFWQSRFMVADSWAIRQASHPARLSRRSPKANQSSSFGARKLGAPRPRPKRRIPAHKVLRSQPCGQSVSSAGKRGGEGEKLGAGGPAPKKRLVTLSLYRGLAGAGAGAGAKSSPKRNVAESTSDSPGSLWSTYAASTESPPRENPAPTVT